jgi:hypothetical protein
MTRRTFGWALVFALGVAFSGVTTVARAADKGATGTWTWTVNRNGQDFTTTLKLKADGEKLTGTVKGTQGNETAIKDGKVTKEGAVSFTVERERNGTTFVIKYAGKLEGDSIKGKTEMTRNGEPVSRDWEAKRAAD